MTTAATRLPARPTRGEALLLSWAEAVHRRVERRVQRRGALGTVSAPEYSATGAERALGMLPR